MKIAASPIIAFLSSALATALVLSTATCAAAPITWATNTADVQRRSIRRWAGPCTADINQNGVCNVIDVQIVIKAQQGCAAQKI